MSFCITYKQALLKNLPSNELKVLIHEGSALYSAKIMRYTPKRLQTHATICKYTLLHQTIKSNAMVVDTTCMQAGPADPHAGAYSGAYD